MNDPFELHGLRTRSEPWNRSLRAASERLGVLCFSKPEKEPLLWSHYAENHRGCCLGFEIREDLHTNEVDLLKKHADFLPELGTR